jgi:hypothetical protein
VAVAVAVFVDVGVAVDVAVVVGVEVAVAVPVAVPVGAAVTVPLAVLVAAGRTSPIAAESTSNSAPARRGDAVTLRLRNAASGGAVCGAMLTGTNEPAGVTSRIASGRITPPPSIACSSTVIEERSAAVPETQTVAETCAPGTVGKSQ